MNVQKELDNLAKDEQKVRNKYGRRFKRFYDSTVNSLSHNNEIIDRALDANKVLGQQLENAKEACQKTGVEV